MKAVESEGTSVEEAVNRALMLLGLNADQVEVSVLRDPEREGSDETALVRVQPKGAEPAPPAAGASAATEEDSARKRRTERASRPKVVVAEPEEVVSGETTHEVAGDHEGGREVPLNEEEGERADRAGDFLEDLFELLDVDCYVEVAADRVDGKILIDIAGPDTGVIIGRKGATLDALELIVNRCMDNRWGIGMRIALDAEGYRERRTDKLRKVALQQALKVSQTRRAISLEPMTPRERRIVHMALKDDGQVQTRSEGEGPDRHVIIEPASGNVRG
jgi:spoIIIJ-associated protein